ncbi:MAG TPA: twin-arginine translocase subunit TatC [Candidatus Saccharimonadales bacterium]|nr:twin-arginine translocase subunit TatC [Candidatus Saccharimonadales bacterium]
MLKTKNKPKKTAKNRHLKAHDGAQKVPFIEHIYELRKRLFYIVLAVAAGGGLAYSIQASILDVLLKPAGNQEFIYTSPGGGFSFLFNLCLYSGILFAIPVMVWQLLRYLQPLMNKGAMRFVAWGSIVSGLLAVVGIVFGYYIGLPAAMHFLLHQFAGNTQIEALIAIQSYLSFVMMYLLGTALLFQVPLVMALINRIKPLKPKGLMKFQRYFIVIAFVLGAVISPSPNIQDQAMLSVPMILMYQLGIGIVWIMNRKLRKAEKVQALLKKDEAARAARRAQFQKAQEDWVTTVSTNTGAVARSAPTRRTWQEPQTTVKSVPVSAPMVRPQTFSQPAERRSYTTISVQTD